MSRVKKQIKRPLPISRALKKLGQDIRNSRLRRRVRTEVMAERASISRATLFKIERGQGEVSLENYAGVLFALGMIERLSNLVDAKNDPVGIDLLLEEEKLPKRIRRPKVVNKI